MLEDACPLNAHAEAHECRAKRANTSKLVSCLRRVSYRNYRWVGTFSRRAPLFDDPRDRHLVEWPLRGYPRARGCEPTRLYCHHSIRLGEPELDRLHRTRSRVPDHPGSETARQVHQTEPRSAVRNRRRRTVRLNTRPRCLPDRAGKSPKWPLTPHPVLGEAKPRRCSLNLVQVKSFAPPSGLVVGAPLTRPSSRALSSVNTRRRKTCDSNGATCWKRDRQARQACSGSVSTLATWTGRTSP